MWHAPNHRVKALANARKRERERKRRPIHLKRALAEIRVLGNEDLGEEATVARARVFLNDISHKGVGVYASIPLEAGVEIALTVEDPKRFYVRGKVVWCQSQENETRIISDNHFPHRLGIKFVFKSDEEREEFKRYIEEMASEILYNDQPAA